MSKFKLALFALDTYSRLAVDKAGADWVGGDIRRARVAARSALLETAMAALLDREPQPRPQER